MLREKIKVAIYIRVSTKEQAEEGYSIEEQEKRSKQECKEQGWPVYKVYSDRGISGKSIKGRPGLQAMLADAELGKFDIVLVWKLNRLSRKLKDTLEIIEKLSSNNVELKSITEKTEINTPEGRLHLHIMSSLGEFERGQISENVKMGMKARAKDGRWNGGIVLGYDLMDVPNSTKKRSDRMLVINPEEGTLVKKIFQMYYNGKGYKAIANQINKEGNRSKKGNPFSVNAIRDILMNPIYCGKIRYDVRSNWSAKRRKGTNPNPVLVPGIHEPIITEEMFDKVQELIKSKNGKPNKVFTGSYPLTGILRCPVCNSGMVAGRVSYTYKDGSKKLTRYYYCGAWRNQGTAVCRSNGIRADEVEKYVYVKLKRLLTSDPFLKATISKVNKKRQEVSVPAENNIRNIEKEIQTLTSNRDMYFKLMEKRAIDETLLLQKLQEIADKIALLEKNKLDLEKYLTIGDIPEVPFDLVKATLSEFGELLEATTSNEERKTLLHLLIEEIKVGNAKRPENVVVKFNKTLVDYITENGGLPAEGSPLLRYKNSLELQTYDFQVGI